MSRSVIFMALVALAVLSLAGCRDEAGTVKSISLDFPHGESRLLVERGGQARLFYGALPRHQKVRDGTFDVDDLYRQLRGRLHENAPMETWPDPMAEMGMVSVRFEDGTEKDFLILNEEEFARGLFELARKNVVGEGP